ncbi:MAG TPA: GntR family transcriptional regulator [Anaerolineales bacterium]|nr:GntR family transcriptional regulator [Anaerolineales bacterium]
MLKTGILSNRLHAQLGELIAKTSPGDRLPTEPKLAEMMGVSRATLREAMRTFETQGLIQRRQGVGTFVVHPTSVIDTGLELLESIESMAQRVGLPVRMGNYEIERRVAEPEEHELLKDSQVLHVSRVMEAEGRPIAYLVDVLPDKLFGEMEFRREFSGSVLDLLLKKSDLRVTSADTEIHAAAAESNEARALHMQRGDVVLHFKSTLFSMDGSVIDLSRSYFLPGYFRFHVIRRVEPRRSTS